MKSLCVMVFVFMLSALTIAQAAEDQFVQAKIYYFGWDVSTRVRLRLDDVRTNAKTEMKINDPYVISNLIAFLNVPAMKKAEGPGDPRLVIDLSSKMRENVLFNKRLDETN
jgi:hypothetical protein